MRIITDKHRYRLRDDAHTSDYMVLLEMLRKEIDRNILIKEPWYGKEPRAYDITLRFVDQEFTLPFHFLEELYNTDFLTGLVDNLHRGPEDRIYTWEGDEQWVRPQCTGCGDCEANGRGYTIGSACSRRLIQKDENWHRKSCEAYLRENQE